jgi:hypothetical protein
MTYEDPPTKKRSLGALRRNAKTKPRSPDFTGPMKLQRHTFETFAKQFEATDDEEVLANIAGWRNQDHQGQYLAVELSPKFVAEEPKPVKKSNLDDFFNDEDDQH